MNINFWDPWKTTRTLTGDAARAEALRQHRNVLALLATALPGSVRLVLRSYEKALSEEIQSENDNRGGSYEE